MEINIDGRAREIFEQRFTNLIESINNSKLPDVKAKKHLRMLALEITDFDGKTGCSQILNEIEEIYNDTMSTSYDEAFSIYCNKTGKIATDLAEMISTNKALNDGYSQISSIAFPKNKNTVDKQDSEHDKNPEFTLSRQVLAIKYMLEEIYSKSGLSIENINDTNIARLIQLLTGREALAKKIKDTRIIKKWRSPLNSSDKEAEKDLNYVAGIFKPLGLHDILDKIKKEIESRENK